MDRRRRHLVTLALLTAAGIAACSKDDPGPTNPGGGGTPTGPSFNFTFPAQGASSAQVFADAGTYSYRCNPHASQGMTGTVVVSATSTNDSALVSVGPGSNLAFSPASVTIKPGGLVRWVNQSSNLVNHTATR